MNDDFLDKLADDTVAGFSGLFTHRVSAGQDPTACMRSFLNFLELNKDKNPELFKKIVSRIDSDFFAPLKAFDQIASPNDFITAYYGLVNKLLEINQEMPYKTDYIRQRDLIAEDAKLIKGKLRKEKDDKKRIVDDTYATQLVQARQIYKRWAGKPLRRMAFLSLLLCVAFLVLLVMSLAMPPSAVKEQILQTRAPVHSMSLNPDGEKLASGSGGWGDGDYTIRIWDLTTGTTEKTLRGYEIVSFSPDGKKLASGSYDDNTVIIWDVATGTDEKALTGHEDGVSSVSFSPDGKKLASASHDNTIVIWDVATGTDEKALTGHEDAVRSVSFSPDGKKLASGSYDNTIIIWDIATGRAEETLREHTSQINSVCFSPDGKKLASGSYDNTIIIWDVASGMAEETFEGHDGAVFSLCFSPDGSQMAGGSYGTITIWNLTTCGTEKILRGHRTGVKSVCFTPDAKKLASGSSDETIIIWDLLQPDPFGPLPPFQLALIVSAFGVVGLGGYGRYRRRIKGIKLNPEEKSAYDTSLANIEKHFTDKQQYEIAESTLRILTTDNE